MKKKYSYIQSVLVIITLILEILPYGVRLTFRPSPDRTAEAFYSFFSLTTVGYGNFGCFIAAILTGVLLVLSLCYIKWQKKALLYWIRIISGLAALSLGAGIILYGIYSYTISGFCIEGLLLFLFIGSMLKKGREQITV